MYVSFLPSLEATFQTYTAYDVAEKTSVAVLCLGTGYKDGTHLQRSNLPFTNTRACLPRKTMHSGQIPILGQFEVISFRNARLSGICCQKQKHTTGGIPRWSPTLVLVARFSAYVWQSGRDAQFSLTCGRMYCLGTFNTS